ncbi:hypothetical protein BSKO_02365 [Bryopsis sp. KO-2023]|nr:hypothetical protein BSKO_02365 [Bryopsis sp. KO-2023]
MWRQELEKASKSDMEGFMQAARLMMKPKSGPRYIGRWDWHLWNFLIALLPACAVYGLAMVGRHQFNTGEQLIALQKEKEELEAKENAPEDPAMKRIQDLEDRIQALQLSLWLTRGSPMGVDINKMSESKGEAFNKESVTQYTNDNGAKGAGTTKTESDRTPTVDKENSVISLLGNLRRALGILDSVREPSQEPVSSEPEGNSLDSKDRREHGNRVEKESEASQKKGQENQEGKDVIGGPLKSILAFWRQSKDSTD